MSGSKPKELSPETLSTTGDDIDFRIKPKTATTLRGERRPSARIAEIVKKRLAVAMENITDPAVLAMHGHDLLQVLELLLLF